MGPAQIFHEMLVDWSPGYHEGENDQRNHNAQNHFVRLQMMYVLHICWKGNPLECSATGNASGERMMIYVNILLYRPIGSMSGLFTYLCHKHQPFM